MGGARRAPGSKIKNQMEEREKNEGEEKTLGGKDEKGRRWVGRTKRGDVEERKKKDSRTATVRGRGAKQTNPPPGLAGGGPADRGGARRRVPLLARPHRGAPGDDPHVGGRGRVEDRRAHELLVVVVVGRRGAQQLGRERGARRVVAVHEEEPRVDAHARGRVVDRLDLQLDGPGLAGRGEVGLPRGGVRLLDPVPVGGPARLRVAGEGGDELDRVVRRAGVELALRGGGGAGRRVSGRSGGPRSGAAAGNACDAGGGARGEGTPPRRPTAGTRPARA